ncbi:AGAP001087-PA [Anopheles gambiae str. PEST]|uniref:AGAP001087-PA n=2 Tax=gambiae species complex TaxID=44542 RepID=Q5TPU2_ANOGA|nr:AGAP001087-PA [Anopheles gambiae str. PEST]
MHSRCTALTSGSSRMQSARPSWQRGRFSVSHSRRMRAVKSRLHTFDSFDSIFVTRTIKLCNDAECVRPSRLEA